MIEGLQQDILLNPVLLQGIGRLIVRDQNPYLIQFRGRPVFERNHAAAVFHGHHARLACLETGPDLFEVTARKQILNPGEAK